MDIVERLRKGLHDLDYQTMLDPLLDDAADEIERLQSINDDAMKINARLRDEKREQAAEIERLREEVRQLEEIMDEEKCASVYLATKRVLKKHGYW